MAASVEDVVRAGIERCREEDWKEGVRLLTLVAEGKQDGVELPGLFYSYLGYGIARVHREIPKGIALCEHAVEIEFYRPENYVNLARTHLLARNRGRAVDAVERGLAIDSRHPELRELQQKLGRRRRPVLRFISRDHPVNRVLGRVRHAVLNQSGR